MRKISESSLELPQIYSYISSSLVNIDSQVDKFFNHNFAIVRNNDFVNLILRRIVMMHEGHVHSNCRIIDNFYYFENFEPHILLILFSVRTTSLNLISKSLSIFRNIFNGPNLAENIHVDILLGLLS
jgi:hypothetical protein